jgi:hypothetical protein
MRNASAVLVGNLKKRDKGDLGPMKHIIATWYSMPVHSSSVERFTGFSFAISICIQEHYESQCFSLVKRMRIRGIETKLHSPRHYTTVNASDICLLLKEVTRNYLGQCPNYSR